ncbi:MAG: rhomboid family intramembrane serine protease [Synechococcales cyanobacterium M58_A2018_015]|nr:rhomboid family intramembrane serine protease [Synechococcales cyanobacterium M58_A2018_015]
MVPIRDINNPTRSTAYVTYGLIIINVLVFIYQLTLMNPAIQTPQGIEFPRLNDFFDTWAIVPAELTAGLSGSTRYSLGPEALTLVTSQFLHGGWLHLGGNMLYLWIFGNNVEDEMGHSRFLVFYLLCGVLAGLAQFFFAPESTVPSLGASGAIAGVLGAYVLRFPQVRILALVPIFLYFFTFQVPAIVFLGFWFVQQAFYGFASLGAPVNIGMESGGIAYWAHAGGFVVGAVLGPLFGLFSGAGTKTFVGETTNLEN